MIIASIMALANKKWDEMEGKWHLSYLYYMEADKAIVSGFMEVDASHSISSRTHEDIFNYFARKDDA